MPPKPNSIRSADRHCRPLARSSAEEQRRSKRNILQDNYTRAEYDCQHHLRCKKQFFTRRPAPGYRRAGSAYSIFYLWSQ